MPSADDRPAGRATVPNRAGVAAVQAGVHARRSRCGPDDVALLVGWFLGPANNRVTGQVIGMDGGLGTMRSR